MIKTAVLGGASDAAAELLRLLLHHPDVDLRWVCDKELATQRVADILPLLAGDTTMEFVGQPDCQDLDLVFLCDEQASSPDNLAQIPQSVKVIDLSTRYRLTDEDTSGFTYGLSEVNRRRMVHDCMRIACPGEVAMALSLALVPLAKNLMLNSDIHATIVVGNAHATTGSRVAMVTAGQYAEQVEELKRVLSAVQTSFHSAVHLTAMQACFARGLLSTSYFKSGVEVDMVRELFEQYYDDHNFTFVIDHEPMLCDVAGTNKCLIHISREGEYLRVTSAIDNHLKGGVGTAVHAMNLLFCLHERTGLML